MPRKTTKAADAEAAPAVAEAKVAAEGSRKSSRIAARPPPPPAEPKAAPKKKKAPPKTAEEANEEPPKKKAKSDEKAEEVKSASKPPSKAPPSKPASKAKPASRAKPASKAKKAEAEGAAAEEPAVPETVPEEKEDVEMEDKENKDEAAAPAPAAPEPEATVAAAEVTELKVGDKLPEWTFKNEKDEDVNIGLLAGEKGLVLFVVPKADTPGCTTQACGFRDSYTDFEKYGYAVFGMSNDTPAALSKWQTKKNLQYSLISDPKRKLIAALGAGTATTTKRSHFVFEKGSGKLLEAKISVKPADSPKQALEAVKAKHPDTA